MNFALDLVLWLLASPILAIEGLDRLARRGDFWLLSYSPSLDCRNCGAAVSLVGLWRCRCGYTYRGHLIRECPVCFSLPRVVRCIACGLTEKLPEP